MKHAVYLGMPVQYRHDQDGPLVAAVVIGTSVDVAELYPEEPEIPHDLVWLAYYERGSGQWRETVTRLIDSPGSPGWQFTPTQAWPSDAVTQLASHLERGRKAHDKRQRDELVAAMSRSA